LTCSHPTLCPMEKNTAYRAAKAFFTYCRLKPICITIHIKKNIPSGAGLAGGSADAAAVLYGLNEMYRTKLTLAQLCEIGATIGADVPFCICGGTMLATGIGDKLCTLTPLPACFIVICKPPVCVSTQKAYQKVDSAVNLKHPQTQRICMALEQNDLMTVAQNLKNVFEQVLSISSVQLITAQMKQLGAIGSCMTGSGSAVLGIFSTKQQAEQCAVKLKMQFQDVFICEPTVQGVQLQKMNKLYNV